MLVRIGGERIGISHIRAYMLHSLTCAFRSEVIKHYAVHTGFQSLVYFGCIAHLKLYLQVAERNEKSVNFASAALGFRA